MDARPEDDRPADTPADAPSPRSLPQQRLREIWRHELVKLTLLIFAGVLVGLLFGRPLAGICVVLTGLLISHLRHLAQLRAWLVSPKRHDLPEAGGLWGEIFDLLLDRQRRDKRKRKRLQGMLAEYEASTAALPDGAVVLGPHGEITRFNHAAATLLGLRHPQDVGLRIANLFRHPSFTEYFTSGNFDREVEAPSPVNAAKTLALRIIPYGNEQRLLIVRDVSELRRLEVARRDFVANASHELRTPLTVLRGYLDMMEPDTQSAEALAVWRKPVLEMRAQAARMEALVNDMLRLARMEADTSHMRNDVLHVPRLLNRALEDARALSANSHRFEQQIQANIGLIGGESELLSIISNLLTNAVRYTPAQGRILARWEGGTEGARLAVEDTGIGIAAADIPRLTERFYRVDIGRSRASGGTGLGLSIVKHALERFDARLEIRSSLGQGSVFVCHFPAHRIKLLAPTAAAEVSAS